MHKIPRESCVGLAWRMRKEKCPVQDRWEWEEIGAHSTKLFLKLQRSIRSEFSYHSSNFQRLRVDFLIKLMK